MVRRPRESRSRRRFPEDGCDPGEAPMTARLLPGVRQRRGDPMWSRRGSAPMRSTLDDFAHRAADRMGPDTFCSITMDDDVTTQQVASNDPRAAAVDQVETQTGDGPCLVAMKQLSAVLV